ncbi:alpha/beta hydrolase [Phaeovulum sp. W22_SRMD_FR3]|uniref:alpha/beta hydrolase n=1 Tax=Phaeovulum sp. W22_SRMD_FR3 TaxID=3240274 RepID=UPI003F98AD1F
MTATDIEAVQATSAGRISRRQLLLSGSAVGAAYLLPMATYAQSGNTASGEIDMQGVEFNNNGITMAGNIYYPPGFDGSRKYPAIVSIHPGGGVKEQTAGLYAARLAAEGFVTLAFDASHQGASGGMPRYLDDPMRRVGDIYSAVDYLTSLAFVDADRIGALGICAGSGAAIKASTTERRIKAVATVSAVDVGAATRKGWDGKASEADQIATLDYVGQLRTAEAAGAAPTYGNYVPAVGDTTAPRDLQEAADYYLTPRGQHPNAPNRLLLTSVSYLVAFTGFDRIETLLTQPLLVVAGSEAGSLWHSEELHSKAAATDKELFIVNGATHMDLYDGAGVDTAMAKVGPFFTSKLA